ncbi:MAG: adenosylmethionine--8-amino-7-oxononanoate transaminase [Deltaproteobacteria bacterium]|jgi:adenosylmethionine-8-amino-7-oxononanoate aminotransferase|nr:adenosylmethionine--8-amino-7-oxononanoate transaminase [Deltaproteobacteria bacterium]
MSNKYFPEECGAVGPPGAGAAAGGLVLAVCGTDTDAGKSVITAGLLRAAQKLGLSCQGIKVVQTGCFQTTPGGPWQAPDAQLYAEAASGVHCSALVTLEAPCSPHLAVELTAAPSAELSEPLDDLASASSASTSAASELSASALAADIKAALRPEAGLCLLEGAGGLLTPLNRRESLADVFSLLEVPVLLVVANKLGAINHALLTLEVLRKRGLTTPGFIMVNTKPDDERSGRAPDLRRVAPLEKSIRSDNPRIISELGLTPCLAEIPYLPGLRSPSLTEQSLPPTKIVSADREAAWDELADLLLPVLPRLLPGSVCQGNKQAVNFENARIDCSKRLLDFDRDHLWHPYTSATRPLPVWQALRTEGTGIWLRDPRNGGEIRVVDGMSSWWAAVYGYNRPEILNALTTQAKEMPHVMFGGLTHAPAVELGQKLLGLAPSGLNNIFLADSGSVSVEAALKMALQYQQAIGQKQRTAIMTIRGGYHGDTLGAMSVCDPVGGMHSLFSGALPRQIFAPRPECRFDAEFAPASVLPLERLFAERGRGAAALIMEPIVQGAGGMWFYHPKYLARARQLCDEYGVLLILDEIATGFGRSGKLFACEWAGIEPDIMCLGKALTGGVLTLAATLASKRVAEGISLDLSGSGGAFMHGPTFMGNPLACAVASASLNLLSASPWAEQVAVIERQLRDGLEPCRALPGVADVRVLGAIGVLEMEAPVQVAKLQEFFVRDCGVWIRPFSRLIYVMPPYVSSEEDLDRLVLAMRRAVQEDMWR